jgi:hypothetical protein
MLLVEYFHKTLDKTSIKSFRQSLLTWYIVVRESKLEPFINLAKTIRRYRKNIEAYIKSRLTTAVAEGLNNKIKVLKRMGYGYSNPTSFCRKILQRCGYLNHLSFNFSLIEPLSEYCPKKEVVGRHHGIRSRKDCCIRQRMSPIGT